MIPVKVGFVGNGSDKFSPLGEKRAREFIAGELWSHDQDYSGEGYYVESVVSGHSPVGGIDIWTEEEALAQSFALDLKVPEINQWDPPGGYGYKARNLDIARDSDVLYVVLADVYPEDYQGRRFDVCYHCARRDSVPHPPHVKSGGCWTGWKAVDLGKDVRWRIINNY